ncbi:MAG: hypothetical protein LWX83_04795 [Anaerolineae bacterium]|nr:hypothetical protein [Anaerolineae bacterium]
MKILLISITSILFLFFVGWLGLQVQPQPFAAYRAAQGDTKYIPLPEGLPKPVQRFYRAVYGDNIPVIKSAVITGRAVMRPVGPFYLPARFRFTHIAGQGYRHYIETTFFGLPIMQVNEAYVNEHARMELPFGTDEGEKLNQAANLGLWAETLWMPAVFLTDERVHWLPVDDHTAILKVPFEDTQDCFVVRFDPQTGLVSWFESMRYHDSNSSQKVLWLNQALRWEERDGKPFFAQGAANWMDDGKPWAIFNAEVIVTNVDVSEYILQKGL